MNRDTLLVTGGCGFIGSCFVRAYLGQGAGRIVNLDKLTYAGHVENIGVFSEDPRHIFAQGDINDRLLIDSLLKEFQPRGIVHFAAESHVDRSIDGPAEFVNTNVLGTCCLLDAALAYWNRLHSSEQRAFRFLHVSTDEVYGPAEEGIAFLEGDPYRPTSPYAASKAADDHFVESYGRTFELPVLVTHCTNNYGPYQFPEKLIPLVIRKACLGGELPVYGDGQQSRDWLFVEDHCAALRVVLKHGRPGATYHIAGGSIHTNLDVVKQICRLVDEALSNGLHASRESLIRFVPDRPAHDRRYALNCEKIRRELRWRPRVKFTEGLRRTVEWYLTNRDWCDRVTRGRYDLGRLGLRMAVGT